MSQPERTHARIRDRLGVYAMRLLDPAEADEIREHLRSCADCREALEQLGAGALPGETLGEHLPEDMIVRWPRMRGSLRGLERELVRRHVGRCARCRDNLRMLGYEPELPHVPELEPSDAVLRRLEPRRRPPLETPPSVLDRLLGAWPVTAWAAAATALIVVALVNPTLLPRRPERSGQARGPAAPILPAPPTPTGTAPEAPLTIDFSPSPARASLVGSVRGMPTRNRIAVQPDTRVLELSMDPPDVPDGARVDVRLTLKGRTLLYTASRPVEDFYGSRRLIIRSSRQFEPGIYELRISGMRGGLPEMVNYSFELTIQRER